MFLFKLRKETVYNLLIEPGRRIHLTSYVREKPGMPPAFCMALRKYLRDTRVVDVCQHDFDRIVLLKFRSKSGEEYTLVVELFREGNLILVGPDGRIRVAFHYRRMRDRNIIVGEEFKLPPPRGRDPLSVSPEELLELVRASKRKDIVRGLISVLSADPHIIEEALYVSGISKESPISDITVEDIKRVLENLQSILNSVREGKLSPCILFQNGKPVGFEPVDLKIYENMEKVRYPSFNEAVDEYFVNVEKELMVEELRKRVESEREKLLNILESQQKRLEELKKESERLFNIGNLIYAHKDSIETILNVIRDARARGYTWDEIIRRIEEGKKRGIKEALMIEEISPNEGALVLRLDGESVVIDIRKSVPENASLYYEKAKKVSEKIEGLERSIEETEKKLRSLEERLEIEVKGVEEKVVRARPKKWYEKFRWFETSDGFLVIAGRDAKQNEQIVRKYLDKDDIFVHADVEGAPHVVIKTGGKTPSETTIFEAAQFAVSYSRAWKAGLGSMDAYWVRADQVSFSAPSGQYLKHGAVMVRGKRNYINNVPLRIALGIVKEGDFWMLIYGPPSAVSKKTNNFVILIPGKTPKNELCGLLYRRLLGRLPDAERKYAMKYITIDDFQRAVPGDSDILEE